jgi:hypothetical protein
MTEHNQLLLEAAAEAQSCGRVGASIEYLSILHNRLTDKISYIDRSDERE